MEHQGENWYKMLKNLNNNFLWTIWSPSISETKCDGDKPNVSAERGGQSVCDEAKLGAQSDLKAQKTGVITMEPPPPSPTMPKYRSTLPRMRPHFTFRHLFVCPKDEDYGGKSGMYETPYALCELSYIEETGRLFHTRKQEHQDEAEDATCTWSQR